MSVFNEDKNSYYYKNVHINNINMLYYDKIASFVNEEILIRQVHHKYVTFVTIGIFLIKGLSFNCMFVMVVITLTTLLF